MRPIGVIPNRLHKDPSRTMGRYIDGKDSKTRRAGQPRRAKPRDIVPQSAKPRRVAPRHGTPRDAPVRDASTWASRPQTPSTSNLLKRMRSDQAVLLTRVIKHRVTARPRRSIPVIIFRRRQESGQSLLNARPRCVAESASSSFLRFSSSLRLSSGWSSSASFRFAPGSPNLST